MITLLSFIFILEMDTAVTTMINVFIGIGVALIVLTIVAIVVKYYRASRRSTTENYIVRATDVLLRPVHMGTTGNKRINISKITNSIKNF